MFKALLAASLALLGGSVAAAWAGPVQPPPDPFHAAPSPAETLRPPLHLIDAAPPPPAASLPDATVVDGFLPVSFSGASGVGAAPRAPVAPEDLALPDPPLQPPAQPVVIPLPTPLYAALALLALAVIARRAILRVC